MDKIDVVLFRYKRERKFSKEFKRFVWGMAIPMIVLLLIDIATILFCPVDYVGMVLVLCAIFMVVWTKIVEGKWGTKKWKYKLMNAYRGRFKVDQDILIGIIKEEGMNCQQVYNLLIKRHNRMPQSADKQTFVITIVSLIVALTSVLASPFQSINIENYAEYVTYVITILILMVPVGYGLYKFIVAQSKQYDEKKNNYEYVIELLEDHLY